jgi:hypothetical protein
MNYLAKNLNNSFIASLDENCCICKKILVDDPSDLGGECCNFCYKDICSECYDKEEPKINKYGVIYYGWVCIECDKL